MVATARPALSSTGSSHRVNAGTVAGIGDINGDGWPTSASGPLPCDPNGLTDDGQAYIVYGKPSPAAGTKFYVVNDASTDRTYEYSCHQHQPSRTTP